MADEIRLIQKKGYTVLQNELVLDKRLSLKTKGLMAVIISRPPGWDFSVAGLALFCGVSRDTVRSCLVELEEAGYLTREQTHNEQGHFAKNIYTIREVPDLPDQAPSEETDTVDEKTVNGENRQRKTPMTVFPPQRNKDNNQSWKEEPPKAPQGGRRRNVKWTADWLPERFEAFWAFYRVNVCKENRSRAIQAWDKLQPDEATITAMARDLKDRLKSEQWKAGIGIPYAATYINQRRWMDGPGREAHAATGEDEDGGTVRSSLERW